MTPNLGPGGRSFPYYRDHAHRPEPPVELWTLRDALGFLLGLAATVLAVVLVLSAGRYPV